MDELFSSETDSEALTGFTMVDNYDRNNWTVTATEKQRTLHDSTVSGMGSVLSIEEYRLAQKIMECSLVPTLSLLGLVANLLNMAVFYRQGLRDKMNLCLFALALTDFLYLLSMFLSVVFCPAAFLPGSVPVQTVRWTIQKFTLNFRYSFMFISGMLTAIVATERCICVVFPMKSDAVFQTKTMLYMIVVVFVGFNLLCLPYALKFDVALDVNEAGNVTVILKDTEFYFTHKVAFHIIRDTILPSLSFLTFFVVSFVTVVTVRKLRTAMDWRQKTSSQVMDKRQLTLVKILIAVSCVYIVCSIPKFAMAIARFLVEDYSGTGKFRKLMIVTHRAGNLFIMINGSVNIIIYYRQSSRFRKELHSACCLLPRSKEETSLT